MPFGWPALAVADGAAAGGASEFTVPVRPGWLAAVSGTYERSRSGAVEAFVMCGASGGGPEARVAPF
jgi:hypothetical protein